ncbi:MAG: hypothetical protein HKN85_01060 [Gammaproteobacteria bacterium]|nr:hypothetical protein [Gammaproteobacteria bacterium]
MNKHRLLPWLLICIAGVPWLDAFFLAVMSSAGRAHPLSAGILSSTVSQASPGVKHAV